jgi:hypothetical protein
MRSGSLSKPETNPQTVGSKRSALWFFLCEHSPSLLALARDLGSSEEETGQLLRKKREERGGFEKGYFLSRGLDQTS